MAMISVICLAELSVDVVDDGTYNINMEERKHPHHREHRRH